MKTIYIVLFTCALAKMVAQKQYSCYRIQEFLWNEKPQKYDSLVGKSDSSVFKFNDEKKTIQQIFEDGSVSELIINSIKTETEIVTYQIISPMNGYHYLYKIYIKPSLIEISLNENNQQIILKKYLFKN